MSMPKGSSARNATSVDWGAAAAAVYDVVGPVCESADFLAKAEALHGIADAINVTDNQGANMRISPLAAAALLVREGIEPIFQITCRDRNRMALQSDLLGAAALGIRNVLALTGDRDAGSPPEGMKKLEAILNRFYKLYAKPEAFRSLIYPETGHVYNDDQKRKMVDWFNRSRKNIPSADKREIPDGVWTKCQSCSEILTVMSLEKNFWVCPKCGRHFWTTYPPPNREKPKPATPEPTA